MQVAYTACLATFGLPQLADRSVVWLLQVRSYDLGLHMRLVGYAVLILAEVSHLGLLLLALLDKILVVRRVAATHDLILVLLMLLLALLSHLVLLDFGLRQSCSLLDGVRDLRFII